LMTIDLNPDCATAESAPHKLHFKIDSAPGRLTLLGYERFHGWNAKHLEIKIKFQFS